MTETRIVVCSECRNRLWVRTDASAFICLSCKHVNTLSNVQQSTRTFLIGDYQNKTKTSSSSSYEARPPRKRALLCGVSYKNQEKYRLPGAINDVKIMNNLLMSTFEFPRDCIRILTDDEKDPALIPRRKNIEQGLRWLVEDSISGDSLVFYFAGRGSYLPDNNGDERDGYDETICPVDFETNGEILDDYINSTIVRPLRQGVVLHAIIDACHSGTILDLQHIYNVKQKKWTDNSPPSGANKGTNSGVAISISACRDDQVAVDLDIVESSGKSTTGVMTYFLAKELKSNSRLTYGSLLNSVQQGIDGACKSGGIKTSIQNQKKRNNFPQAQEVQLSSSMRFNVYGKPFNL